MVDLRHQADGEDYEEDFSFHEALLEVAADESSERADGHKICLSFRSIRVGCRQRIVILVMAILTVVMIPFAVRSGPELANSSLLARVYVIFLAALMVLLGGALAYYGFSYA